MTGKRHVATLGSALLAVVVLTGGVYWPGLNGPVILDDVVNLQLLRDLASEDRLSLASILAERGGIIGGRPVSWLTFYLNWRLTGDDIWSLKLTNLALHLITGVLLFFLAKVLLEIRGDARHRHRTFLLALLTAAFWLLMPMQVSTVLYVIQRMAQLSALFCIAGLLTYVHGRIRLRADRPYGRTLVLASILLFWPLATLSKQNGALLGFLLLATELLVLRPVLPRPRWPNRVLVACCASIVVAGTLRVVLDPNWLAASYEIRTFTLTERLLTQPRVILDYLLNVYLLPGGTPLGLFHDDFPISRSLLQPLSTLPAMLALLAIPAIAWMLRRGSAALAGYGATFFLVAHALEAGPFPLEIYFEHRNYLPSAGLALAAGSLVGIPASSATFRRVIAALALVLLLGYVLLTATRVGLWTSWESIVEANAVSHPRSPRAQAGMAILAFQDGRVQDGVAALEKVVEFGGQSFVPGAVIKTLVGYCLARETAPSRIYDALRALPELADAPYTVGALRWYRQVSESGACDGLDTRTVANVLAAHVSRLVGTGPFQGNWILYDEVSRLLAAEGRPRAALAYLQAAHSMAPSSARAQMLERMRSLSDHVSSGTGAPL